jgi:hypothetical protein
MLPDKPDVARGSGMMRALKYKGCTPVASVASTFNK